MSLREILHDFFLQQGFDKTYWIAYSGGLDSHALLHVCAQLRSVYPLKLKVIHVNHSLSPNASAWAAHCEKICHDLQIDFVQHTINAKASIGESPEEIARERRYALFAEQLSENDMLVTAHQQDDQAETVLLQLLRGAGPKGLAAMPSIKPFGKGWHARPLLNVSREDLQKYAEQHQLTWINDESNTNTDFARNFLRHDVLPIFKKRWPTIAATVSRTAEHCAEAQQLIDSITRQDLSVVKNTAQNTLSVTKLRALDSARQRYVLRAWLQELHFPIPSTIKMRQIQQDFLYSSEDKLPHMVWEGVELRRYQDMLYALHELSAHDETQIFHWDLQEPLQLPNVGVLHAQRVQGQGLRADINNVTVQFRRGGEQIRLPGRQHHHEVKKLFQEWNVLPWQRDRVPLIYVEDTLIALAGYCIAEGFAAEKNQEGYLLNIV